MLDHNYLFYKPIEENDRILILGATGGDFIKEHRREIISKNAFVVNVEPMLDGIIELAKFIRVAMPNNACILSCATSNYHTIETMDIRDNLITSTLQSRPETNMRWPMPLLYQAKVPVLTLDTIILMCDKVDKIFCDIEGSEIETFAHSGLVGDVPYVAIAAYHMRDGEPTHVALTNIFKNTHSISITGQASFRQEEQVFFATKEG